MSIIYQILIFVKYDQFPNYQAIGIGKHIPHSQEKLRKIRKSLQELFPYNIYYENRKYIIILFNFPKTQTALSLKSLTKSITPPTDYNLVISSVTNKENIHRLFRECLDMIRFNREYHVFNAMTISDLGIFRYLLDSDQFLQDSLVQQIRQLKVTYLTLF